MSVGPFSGGDYPRVHLPEGTFLRIIGRSGLPGSRANPQEFYTEYSALGRTQKDVSVTSVLPYKKNIEGVSSAVVRPKQESRETWL